MMKKRSTVLIILLFCPILAGYFAPNVKAGEIEDIKARLLILEQKMGIVSKKSPIVESGIDFNWIMNSMSKVEEIDAFNENGRGGPFKINKNNDGKWQAEQQENWTTSLIVSLGGKKVQMNHFPPDWWMNGTWVFSVKDNDCQLMHEVTESTMEWKCG